MVVNHIFHNPQPCGIVSKTCKRLVMPNLAEIMHQRTTNALAELKRVNTIKAKAIFNDIVTKINTKAEYGECWLDFKTSEYQNSEYSYNGWFTDLVHHLTEEGFTVEDGRGSPSRIERDTRISWDKPKPKK